MSYTIEVSQDAVDGILAEDLTECYLYAVRCEDGDLANAVKLLLEKYYMSPTEYSVWLSKHNTNEVKV